MKVAIISLFVVLLIGSVVFAFERILFSDASFILFRIINLGSLQIQEQRYGSFITQIFPLFGVWLHLPLNWIVILYSASFNLFFLAVVSILLFRFKEYSLAILMSFYYVLIVSDTWFWTNNEVHQGIAWMFLLFGTVFYFRKRNLSIGAAILVFLILAFFSIYTHPLILFPCTFLWLFFMLQKEYWLFDRRQGIIFSGLLILICASKFFLITNGQHYDADMLHSATRLSLKQIALAFVSPLAKEIVYRTLWNYWLVPLLFGIGIYYGIRQKKYISVLLAFGFSLAYFLAVCITFNNFFAVHIESELMPLSIIAAAPFVYYALPKLKPKSIPIVLTSIFLIRLAYIGASAEKFINRKEWLYASLQTMREKKITKGIIYEDFTLRNKLFMTWSIPDESLLASSLQNDQPNITFIVGRADKIRQQMTSDPHFKISTFDKWKGSSLNEEYFHLDTTSTYQLISVVPK